MKFSFQNKISSIALGLIFFAFCSVAFGQTDKPQIAKNIEPKVENIEPTKTEPESSAAPISSSSILTRIGTDPTQTKPLSLNDAIKRALENNNNIEVARNDVRIAESQLRSLLGAYDPVVTISPSYSNNVQPQPSTLGGADLSGVTRSNSFAVDSNFNHLLKKGGGSYRGIF